MIAQHKMVQNILDMYNRANPAMLEDGHNWYITQNALVHDIARSTDNSPETVAACIAHLSPRTMWSRNVLACQMLLTGQDKPSGIMSRSWDMAQDAWDSDNPLETLNGPKVSRFARNLLLDDTCITVDVWALRVACGDRWDEVNLKHKGVYEKIEKAYLKAADILGIAPANLQAITWCTIRGRSV